MSETPAAAVDGRREPTDRDDPLGGTTVDRLYEEIHADDDGGVRLAPDQALEPVLDRVFDGLFDDEAAGLDEETVKTNLDEILLLLIAGRSSDRHGKALIGDLQTVFDAHLSPGTVYPRLHDLEEEGTLRVQPLVRTKEYEVADEAAMVERVEGAMRQHLAMGLFLRAALAELA
jgi:hypothetical protein